MYTACFSNRCVLVTGCPPVSAATCMPCVPTWEWSMWLYTWSFLADWNMMSSFVIRQVLITFSIGALFLDTCDTFPINGDWYLPQVSVCIPVLRLSRRRKKVLFYCHFPDQLLSQRASALKRLYRAPIDWMEERTTGMADMVGRYREGQSAHWEPFGQWSLVF